MTALALPSTATRITLPGVARWTLGRESVEGRRLGWKPQGEMRKLGSGTSFSRSWAHRGFLMTLDILWSVGLTSSREAWTGSAWGASTELPTAQAYSEIIEQSAKTPASVEAYLGSPLPSFQARGFEKGIALQDIKGIAHTRLQLGLEAVDLVDTISFEPTGNPGWGVMAWGTDAWGG